MKDYFRGFYTPTTDEFERMWRDGIIVLDTNVLLNLYRIPEIAREELLTVLDNFKDKIWVPHQVALEFQKGRLKVIFLERKRTEEMLNTAESTVKKLKENVESLQIDRHGVGLESAPILDALAALNEKLVAAIKAVQGAQLEVASADPVRERLDVILSGRVGTGPRSQEELDELTKDAEKRFKHSIPPGFKDIDKSEGRDSIFVHDKLVYERQFGDLILWRQIINHVKDTSINAVIFVTDDSKEDWWRKEHGRTIGAHPELVREITQSTSVEHFWIYSYANFLTHAKNFANATISDTSVDEVREASQSVEVVTNSLSEGALFEVETAAARRRIARRGVLRWLRTRFEIVKRDEEFPAIVVQEEDGALAGYEVIIVSLPKILQSVELVNAILRGCVAVMDRSVKKFWVVVVFDRSDLANILTDGDTKRIRFELIQLMNDYPITGIIAGYLTKDTVFKIEFMQPYIKHDLLD